MRACGRLPWAGAAAAARFAISTKASWRRWRGGAGQMGGGSGVAVFGVGGDPVGLEQFPFDALEGCAHGGLGDGGEFAGKESGAAEAVVEGDVAVVAVGPVGVGLLVVGREVPSRRKPW